MEYKTSTKKQQNKKEEEKKKKKNERDINEKNIASIELITHSIDNTIEFSRGIKAYLEIIDNVVVFHFVVSEKKVLAVNQIIRRRNMKCNKKYK